MVATTTTKLARGADTATFPMGFLDTGAGSILPVSAQTDATGEVINPATAEGLEALLEALADTLKSATFNALSVVQTSKAIAAGAGQSLIAANPARRFLSIINTGVGDVSLGFGAAVAAGAGWPLNAADAAGRQGGSMTWEGTGVPTNQIFATSAADSTVFVLEG